MTAVAREGDGRVGDWMITQKGKRFWPLDPRPDEVDFHDVAHALSMICRYGGHAGSYYSVAEHCCLLAWHFRARGELALARYALLHDATEAYIGDMIRPLKRDMPRFRDIERRIFSVIAAAAGTEVAWRALDVAAVEAADTAIIRDEAEVLFTEDARAAAGWVLPPVSLGVTVLCLPQWEAKRAWLDTFRAMFPDLKAWPF